MTTLAQKRWWWQQMQRNKRARHNVDPGPGPGPGPGTWGLVDEWPKPYDLSQVTASTFAGFGVRIVLAASMFTPASKLRLTFTGSRTDDAGTLLGLQAFVGVAASGGNPWDFAAAPAPLLFGGAATADVPYAARNTPLLEVVSDELAINVTGAQDIVVAFSAASGEGGSSQGLCATEPDAGWHLYLDTSGNTSDQVAPAGLLDVRAIFGNNHMWMLNKVEAYG